MQWDAQGIDCPVLGRMGCIGISSGKGLQLRRRPSFQQEEGVICSPHTNARGRLAHDNIEGEGRAGSVVNECVEPRQANKSRGGR